MPQIRRESIYSAAACRSGGQFPAHRFSAEGSQPDSVGIRKRSRKRSPMKKFTVSSNATETPLRGLREPVSTWWKFTVPTAIWSAHSFPPARITAWTNSADVLKTECVFRRLIIENIRKKTGGTLPILCRINGSDEVDGGQSVQDAAAVAVYLDEVCGVDAIHVNRAVHLHDECMWAPGVVHGGFNAPFFTEIKNAVSVPVIAVGRFTEPQYAELMVRQGQSGYHAFGRQTSPIRSFRKKRRRPPGRTDSMHRMSSRLCSEYVSGQSDHMSRKSIRRQRAGNPAGREPEKSGCHRRRSGGLYAAQLCALRGHDVTLFEKTGELGGNFRIAAYPPGKGDITGAIRNLIVKCQMNGVRIQLNTEVTEELLRNSSRMRLSSPQVPHR